MSQAEKIYNLLKDGEAHSTSEILNKVYGLEFKGYANIHGRITDLRKKYGINIINFKDDKIKSLTYYQIIPPKTIEPIVRLEDMPEYQEYRGSSQIRLNNPTI